VFEKMMMMLIYLILMMILLFVRLMMFVVHDNEKPIYEEVLVAYKVSLVVALF
jgi:hypothetical protein